MIQNDQELKGARERISHLLDLLAHLRTSSPPQELALASAGYRADIEHLQREVLDYLTHVATNSVSGDGARSAAAFQLRFDDLAAKWRQETDMYSSISKKIHHPAYQEIIALGPPALPLILRDLRDKPAHWFEALKAIAKETPVAAEDRPSPQRARDAWLAWGQEKGLI